jgi:hypothetical protein
MALDNIVDVNINLNGKEMGMALLIGIDSTDMFFTDIKGDIYVRHNQSQADPQFRMYDSGGNHYIILPVDGKKLFYKDNAIMAEMGRNQLRELLKDKLSKYSTANNN